MSLTFFSQGRKLNFRHKQLITNNHSQALQVTMSFGVFLSLVQFNNQHKCQIIVGSTSAFEKRTQT